MAIKTDMSKAKQKAKEEAARAASFGNFGPMPFWKPKKPGKYNLRFMPPWTDDGANAYQWWREVWVHWGVGPDDENRKNVTCPKKTPGSDHEDCPICEEMDRLKATGDPADLELVKEMRAKIRIYANIIDLDDPQWTQDEVDELAGSGTEEDKLPEVDSPKIQVFGFGTTIFKELLDFYDDELDFTDLEEGYDVRLTREGTKKNDTKYRVRLAPKVTEAPVPDDDPIVHNLDMIQKVLSTPEITAIMEGVDPEEVKKLAAAKAKSDAKKKASQKKLSAAAKAKEEAEAEEPEAEEEAPEETPEEEPEVEAKPAAKKGPGKKKGNGKAAKPFPPLDEDGSIDFNQLTDEQIEDADNEKHEVTFTDQDGDEVSVSPHVSCYGAARQRSEDDQECTDCPLFERCGARIEALDAAEAAKSKKKGPGKGPGKKPAGKKSSDDLEEQMRASVGKK